MNTLIHPITKKVISLDSKEGIQLINNYITIIKKKGGNICSINRNTNRCSKKGTTTPELCTLNSNNRCVKIRRQIRQRVRQSRQRQQPRRPTNVCKRYRKTKQPRCEDHLNCIWVKRQGCKERANQPELQTLVGNQSPIVLNLKLTRNADPTGALHKQEDLLEQFKEVCPNYETIYHTFNDFSDIERILTNLSNRKIAQLIILTHGSPNSIMTGKNEEMIATPVKNRNFKKFVEILKSMLLPRASVLLTACLTGKNELFDHLEDKSNRSLLIKNMEINNFANVLAKDLKGHEIFCTPKVQVANELQLIPIGKRNETKICSQENERPVNWDIYLDIK